MALTALPSASVSPQAVYAVNRATQELSDSIYRLTSGDRYLSGEDNASLSLAVQLQAQASTYRQSISNSIEANSLLDVAGGGLSQISSLLTHARGLAQQAT